MKNLQQAKLFTISLVFFTLITVFPRNSLAVCPGEGMTERWVCLDGVRCDDPKAGCSGKGVKVHRAKLTAKPDSAPLSNKTTYIVECLAAKAGDPYICTTADENGDLCVYKQSNITTLNGDPYNYKFQGLFKADGVTVSGNPVSSFSGPYEWQDFTPEPYMHKFMALNYLEPEGARGSGAEGGQQQATFSFTNQFNRSDCVSVNWDPYGRVFDATTLEPVNSARVELLKKDPAGDFTHLYPSFNIVIQNPYPTLDDGKFSFVVPDGTYRLRLPATDNPRYTIATDTSLIHPNYVKIYSDIYPSATGLDIVQSGTIQHRDIPVVLKPGEIRLPTVARLMEQFHDLNKTKRVEVVEGRASHPFTIVKAYSETKSTSVTGVDTWVKNREIASVISDKMGRFRIEINTVKFAKDEKFGRLTFTKSNLTTLAGSNQLSPVNSIVNIFRSLFGKVLAEESVSTSVQFDPIPNYLEGYAYDAAGKPIPNAKVGIYLSFSKRASYEVKADSNGYYKVASEFLPSMPYTIQYTRPTGQTVTVTTSKFIAQNTDTFKKNNINIAQTVAEDGKVINSQSEGTNGGLLNQGSQSGNNLTPGQSNGTAPATNQTFTSGKTGMILIFAVIVLLLIGALVTVGVYWYRKNKVPSIQS